MNLLPFTTSLASYLITVPLIVSTILIYFLLLKPKPTATQGHCIYLYCFKYSSLTSLGLSSDNTISERSFLITLSRIAYPYLYSLIPLFCFIFLHDAYYYLTFYIFAYLFTVCLIPPLQPPIHTRM